VSVLADSGALYALLDRDDAWHARVRDWWSRAAEDVLVPAAILPELTYFLHRRLSPCAEAAFTRAVAAGEFALEPLDPADVVRAAELMGEHADLPLGFVDAAVAAAAERIGATGLLTTDRRHFARLRPRHIPAFRLLP
jgi:predicted nucleic acid-binding protein